MASSIITQVTREDVNQPKQAFLPSNSGQTRTPNNDNNLSRRKKLAIWWDKLTENLCCWCSAYCPHGSNTNEDPPIIFQPARVVVPRSTETPRAEPQQLSDHLLPQLINEDKNKKTLVLDLDETLVHSSFKPIVNADFVIPVEIEDQIQQVYVF